MPMMTLALMLAYLLLFSEGKESRRTCTDCRDTGKCCPKRHIGGISGLGDIRNRLELPEEMTTEDFAAHIKEALGLSAVRCTAVSKMLRTVAVVGGAGGDYALAAQAKGADAFVTGEVKHHEVIAAQQAGLALYEAGHYHTELPYRERLKAYLDTACPGVEFIVSESERPPMETL